MKVKPPRIVFGTLVLMALLMLLIGLLFIFQQIPPNAFFGLMPEGDFVGEEPWYVLNTLLGWICSFVAATTLIFLLLIRKKTMSTFSLLTQTMVVLFSAIMFSAITFEFLNQFINI